MTDPKFIAIDGKPVQWRALLQRRREQLAAVTKGEQRALFGERRPATRARRAANFLHSLQLKTGTAEEPDAESNRAAA